MNKLQKKKLHRDVTSHAKGCEGATCKVNSSTNNRYLATPTKVSLGVLFVLCIP